MAKKLRYFLLATVFLLSLSYPSMSQLTTKTFSHDCDQTYGFMPCTDAVLGNAFLILVYGYCIFRASKIMTDGSEILREILGPGVIGGLLLLVFSSLPNAIIILGTSELLIFYATIIRKSTLCVFTSFKFCANLKSHITIESQITIFPLRCKEYLISIWNLCLSSHC